MRLVQPHTPESNPNPTPNLDQAILVRLIQLRQTPEFQAIYCWRADLLIKKEIAAKEKALAKVTLRDSQLGFGFGPGLTRVGLAGHGADCSP